MTMQLVPCFPVPQREEACHTGGAVRTRVPNGGTCPTPGTMTQKHHARAGNGRTYRTTR